MILTFSYRIKDASRANILTEKARAVNVVWNFCNETQLVARRCGRRWPTGFDLDKLTVGSSKELGLHSQSIQAICAKYAENRNTVKKARLRFRGKRSLGWIPFKASGVKLLGDTVTYCGHTFRFWLSRPVEGKLKTGSFSQDARGRWYVHFQCEVEAKEPTMSQEEVGIDLGLEELATLSTGEKIEAPRFYRELEPKLAVASRAGKKKQVTAIHAKIANRRNDFLHKLSTRLVSEFGVIFVGNVSSSKLAKTRMAKSVMDAGWGMLRTFLSYKATARRGRYIEVQEAYSTRTCSECDALSGPKGIAGLGIREWVCSGCGTLHDRDVNSAILILRLGHQTLAGGIPHS